MKHFLESEFKPAVAEAAGFHVISAPMELSVSYGAGARKGPEAIIDASQQLEADIYGYRPGDLGIYTRKPINVASKKPEAWMDAIEAGVAKALKCGAIPVLLGASIPSHWVLLVRSTRQERRLDLFILMRMRICGMNTKRPDCRMPA